MSCPDFLREGSWILAQIFSYIFKEIAFVQRILDVDTVLQDKVFLVAGNMFTHKISVYCCQKEI